MHTSATFDEGSSSMSRVTNRSTTANHSNHFHRYNKSKSVFINHAEPAASSNFMRSELTVNLTRDEPRLVIFNPSHHVHANPTSQPHHHHKFITNPPPFNRFKYFKNDPNQHHNNKTAAEINHAPYNTTQYIMFDFNRRHPGLKEQVCPNEQQQFSEDWNNSLNSNNSDNPNFRPPVSMTTADSDSNRQLSSSY